MSKQKKPVDDGYPFGTGDWEKWSNKKRLDWLRNFRDKTRDKYKDKFNISDEDIAKMSADIEGLENVVLHEEFTAAQAAARKATTPRETAKMIGELIDDVCANDYYKARKIGMTDADVDKMRADADKYLREIEEWERKQTARDILGFAPPKNKPAADPTDDTPDIEKISAVKAFSDIDDSALKAAFESGDQEAVDREFKAWTAKLEAKAAKDPVFAKWFEEFCAEQELLLRWDDTIGDEDDEEEKG